MMAERAQDIERDELLSDEEVRERLLADPGARKRIAEALKASRKASSGPGVSAKDLADFLREHQ
jgi:hypothetical protein